MPAIPVAAKQVLALVPHGAEDLIELGRYELHCALDVEQETGMLVVVGEAQEDL